jgi:hypothetical protein
MEPFKVAKNIKKRLKRKTIMQIQFAICLLMDGNVIANRNFQI